MSQNENKNKPVVYVPAGAKLNVDGKPMKEPKVEYDKRKVKFDLEATKKIAGGRYGREARNRST
jgi:hypothetical protein